MLYWITMFREFEFFLLLSSLLNTATAFNVDLSNPVIFTNGANQSMFGFTVAGYKENGTSWVLVGAPKNRDEYFSNQTRKYKDYNATYQGGSLYYCDVFSKKRQPCSTVKFPTENEHFVHLQGLGASLATSGSNGVVMVCAPRVYYFDTEKNIVRTHSIGNCYYSKKGINNFARYFANDDRMVPRDEYTYREAGFSAAISKDSKTFYAGALSTMDLRGYLMVITPNHSNEMNFKKELHYDPNKSNDFSYFGYSITSLNFSGTQGTGIAVALPKANHFQGKVTIFTSTFSIGDSIDLTGQHLGAYFGYSICTSDIDGDGSDDLIIGEPLHSYGNNFSNQLYDHGRIYVYYQGNLPCNRTKSMCWKNKFNKSDFIDGEHSRGYFGFAIASLGDINRDGFGDIVVGAPYEEWTENCLKAKCTGTVYIYHGSSQGIVKKYSQVIKASDIYHLSPLKNLPLISFGSSLAGGLDLDGNSYPDLVVGALESDVVFLFRSKPVINLTTTVYFSNSSIVLNKYSCKLKNQTEVICVDLKICLRYDGKDVENRTSIIMNITLDHGKTNAEKRMYFYKKENEKEYHDEISLLLNRNKTECQNKATYVAHLRENQDKVSPIEVQINCSLATSTIKDKNDRPSGVLNNGPAFLTKSNLFIKNNNCGQDNKCIPYLSLFMNSNFKNIVLQADFKENIDLQVIVKNQGEDAYNSVFKLKVPGGLSYSNTKNISSFENVSVFCLPPNADNGFTIECNIGNPLPAGKTVRFTMSFDANGNAAEDSQFKFSASVNSVNLELNATAKRDSEKTLNISITEVPNIFIKGSSTPHEIYNISSYNSENTETEGPILLHKYVIQNLGVSEISEAVATFHWPSKLSSGENLLYLISDPITKGSVYCNRIDHSSVSDEHLKLKPSYEQLMKMDDDSDSSSFSYNEIETTNRTYYGFGFCNETATNSPEYSFYCNKERTRFFHRWGKNNGIINRAVNGVSTWAIGDETLKVNPHGTNKRIKRSNREIKTDTSDTIQPNTIHSAGPSKKILLDSITSMNFNCSTGKCIRIQCLIKNLRKKQAVSVTFPSIVWVKTIHEMTRQEVARVSSYVQVNITKLAGNVKLINNTLFTHEVFTNIKTLDLEKSTPRWIIVGSALIGVLLLMAISYGMYKVGFFKRNRPDGQALQNVFVLDKLEE